MININIKKGFPVFTEKACSRWAILDLDQGPSDYESPALTAELMAQISRKLYTIEDLA